MLRVLASVLVCGSVALAQTSQPASRPTSSPATQPTKSIVYVVNYRGGAMDHEREMRECVLKAVGKLKPEQRFNLIVCQDEDTPMLAEQMINADKEAVERVTDFIYRQSPRGFDSSLAGIKAAVALKPEVIWLFATQVDQVDKFIELAKGAKVNVLFFGWKYDLPDELARIAAKTGGICVSAEDGSIYEHNPDAKPPQPPTPQLPEIPLDR